MKAMIDHLTEVEPLFRSEQSWGSQSYTPLSGTVDVQVPQSYLHVAAPPERNWRHGTSFVLVNTLPSHIPCIYPSHVRPDEPTSMSPLQL